MRAHELAETSDGRTHHTEPCSALGRPLGLRPPGLWLALWLALWLCVVPARPGWSAPADPGWALIEVDHLPQLIARRASAQARIDARERFTRGDAGFSEAYPRRSVDALGDPALLRGRLALLDAAAIERARALDADPPEPLTQARHLAAWRAAVDETLQREARADALEREQIVATLARLADHPELSEAALQRLRGPLLGARAEARALPDGADEALRRTVEGRAAIADEELALLDRQLLALRLPGSGRPPWDPAPDLERLADPARAQAAADRLWLALPFLAEAEGASVDEALSAYADAAIASASEALAAPAPKPSGEPVEPGALDRQLQQAEAALATAQARAEGLSGADGAGARLAALAQLQLRLAQRRVDALRARLQRARGEAPDLQTAKTQAEDAAAAAEAAHAAAADARDQRLADILSDFAASSARVTAVQEEVASVDARMTAHQETVHKIATQQRDVEKILELSALSDERPDPDKVYRELRHLLRELRASPALRGEQVLGAQAAQVEAEEATAADRRRIADAEALIASLEGEPQQRLQETLSAWRAGLEQELLASRRWVDLTQQERDTLFEALQQARVAKRDLSPYISSELRQQDNSMLLPDIAKELQLLVPSIWSSLRSRSLDLMSAPVMLTDWNVLRGLLASSFWSILSGLFWWWGRNQAEAWARTAATRVRRVRPELRLSDVAALRDPMARAIRNTIDLLLGPLLLWSLGEGLPELQFLVRVYLYLSTYRALLAAFDLVVVPNTQVRPALLVLSGTSYALARRTVQLFLSYAIVSRLLHFLLWGALGLDTLSGLVDFFLSLLFWLLVAISLYRWEPITRAGLQRRQTAPNPLLNWLRVEGSALLRVPRAVGQLLFFGAVLISDLSHRLAQEGTSLAWLFNVMNRYRLKEGDPGEVESLPEEIRARILEGDTPAKHLLQREELSAVGDALQQWRATGLRGLVAVVGDRGVGKETALHSVGDTLRAEGLEVRRTQMPDPVRNRQDLFAWLSNAVGCELGDKPEDMVEKLEAVEPRAVLLEGVHRCFARRVGGVNLFQMLLYVLNATSDHHFYVVSVHGPAWDYLSSVGSMVDCGVFRTVVRLAPMTSAQLRSLTLARAGEAGLHVDFSGLQRASALGGDPEVELERSIGVFYRLLAEASAGSPTVALELFTRCLEPTDDPHRVQIIMGSALSVQVIPDLFDNALFVLVAINLHEQLRQEELVDVTNLSVPVVRATVRDLVSRGLLTRINHVVFVPDRHRVAVQRTLRRRHFLHLGADR